MGTERPLGCPVIADAWALYRACLALSLCVLLAWPFGAAASTYAPEGFYTPTVYKLDNGLTVVLNRRAHARNVAVRLAVDVGFWDFPCETHQAPHLLEHLYFAGTSAHSEEELDAAIQRHGGTWNATTDPERTVYAIDILSDRIDVALKTLHEVLTDSTMTDEQIADAKKVVMRELGGEQTTLARWFAPHGFGESGWARAFSATGLVCGGLPDLALIDSAHLQAVREQYYRASRMTLVVVGNTTRDALDRLLSDTLAQLPTRDAGPPQALPPKAEFIDVAESRFETLVGAESEVGYFYRVPGYLHPDYPAIRVATRYLTRQLFNRIRVREGLAYDPGAEQSSWARAGIVFTYADVNVGDEQPALELMREEIARMARGDVDADALHDVKQGMLLAGIQGYEANADVADYYVESLDELGRGGRFRDEEAAFENVSAARVAEVVANYLIPAKGIQVVAAPTLTSRSLYIALAVALSLLVGSIYRRSWRR